MKYYVSFLLILMLFVSCSSKGNKATTKQKSEIGKYVYIDKAGVLHTKNGCKAVFKEISTHSEQFPIKTGLFGYFFLSFQ